MYLGLDLGTSSAKAMLLSDRGVALAQASRPYPVRHPAPDRAESDPEAWWSAVAACVQELPTALRAQVRAIGLSGQMHGAVFSDPQSRPLRPAILWLDRRAAGLRAALPQDLLERTGNPFSAGMTAAILAWQVQQPGGLPAGTLVMQAKDWLHLRLTGIATSEFSDASGTLLADRAGNWDPELLAGLGLTPAILNPVLPSASAAGGLAAASARLLGLPAGIPVACGAGDTAAAAFGGGLYHAGDAQLTTGSGAQLVVMCAQAPPADPALNAFCAVRCEGLPGWYAMAAMQNCGIALEWVRRLLGLSWPRAYELAFQPAAGASHALFVPHLSGERTPWMDAELRASWSDLGVDDDAGSLMRAAFTGVAFSIRAGLDALRRQGLAPARLRLAGGGSVHAEWRQLLATILATPLDAVDCPDASARGAALLGAVADGMPLDALRAMAPQLVPVASGEPDPALEADYLRYRARIMADRG